MRPLSEWHKVLAASELTGLSTLGVLARDSIEVGSLDKSRFLSYILKFSTLETEEKSRLISIFERQWKEYVDYLLEN